MINKNILYKTEEISAFYSQNRRQFADYYLSERTIIEKVAHIRNGKLGHILDVGCACGGLSDALHERFEINSYTGVDINEQAIYCAKKRENFFHPHSYIHGDILHLDLDQQYDMVFSFGCADWNIQTLDIIQRCWEFVADNGFLIISLRITPDEGVNDIQRSYQEIKLTDEIREQYEKANYVVFNFFDAIRLLTGLVPKPVIVHGFGYWGIPAETAHTPYKKLTFMVFALHKKEGEEQTILDLTIPSDIISL